MIHVRWYRIGKRWHLLCDICAREKFYDPEIEGERAERHDVRDCHECGYDEELGPMVTEQTA